jgi:hypothetical protein
MGYYNNPEKTALAFTQNPLNKSYPELIYRTGDVVNINEFGEIMFKGRKDNLIKHLGYRIDLGEIEHVIINVLKLVKQPFTINSKIDYTEVYEFFYKQMIIGDLIIDLELEALFLRINKLGYIIKLTEAVKEYIAEKGFDSNFGARPLKRAIQKYLEDPIAEEILKGGLSEGDTMEVDYNQEKKEIQIICRSKGKKTKEEKTKE